MADKLVLLVEDDSSLARVVKAYLENSGMRCIACEDGNSALRQATALQPDIIVLDRLLPGKDGLTLCRELREVTAVPVIMVTALTSDADRLEGFAAGVDDYICKPFNPAELVARIEAVLRRSRQARADIPFVLDRDGRRLIIKGCAVDITRGEYAVLSLLMSRYGAVVSRQDILDAYQAEGSDSFDRAIDNHIYHLRRKIAAHWPSAVVIRTVYGGGYCFSLETLHTFAGQS